MVTAVAMVLLLAEVGWASVEFALTGPSLVTLGRGAPTVGTLQHIKCTFTPKGTEKGRLAPVRFQVRVDGQIIKNVLVPVTPNQVVCSAAKGILEGAGYAAGELGDLIGL